MAEVVVFGTVAADVILRVPAVPAPGGHVNATALGWRIGGSSANVACGLAMAGHHVQLVGPVGSDQMGDSLLAELGQSGVDTGYAFRDPSPSPRALVLIDDAGERTILVLSNTAFPPSYHLPRVPSLRSADCVYIESYSRYPADIADTAPSALVVTSPPDPDATTWPATIVVGSERDYRGVGPGHLYDRVRSVVGDGLNWVVVTRGPAGADAHSASTGLHVEAHTARQRDATGAGDAFTAGLLHGLLRGDDMTRAMTLGAEWGAATVEKLQSIPVPLEDLVGPP